MAVFEALRVIHFCMNNLNCYYLVKNIVFNVIMQIILMGNIKIISTARNYDFEYQYSQYFAIYLVYRLKQDYSVVIYTGRNKLTPR